MSKFNYHKIMPRFNFLAFVLTVGAIAVLGQATYIMTAKKTYWMKVASRVRQDSVRTQPIRGNILSCDGQLLASSLPEFKIYMDFQQLHVAKQGDSLWHVKLDSICQGLHRIFPEQSAQKFKAHLMEGYNKRRQSGPHKGERVRNWVIWPKRIDYNTYSQVRDLPLFRLGNNKSGFHFDELNARENPYGSLAKRTIGDVLLTDEGGRSARYGLELSYDSLLKGAYGTVSRQKVLGKYLSITNRAPINGCDIMTTIDVGMQDLAERALVNKLEEIQGSVGVAIVMEVATGDIKAIVNMEKCDDGKFREIQSHAVSDLMEPGSVFKTASVMTALEDGVCDTTFKIPTGNGIWHIYGRDMKDSHWKSGGYGTISLGRAMELSSNIGVSYVIDKYYHNDPEKFVRGIYRTGINGAGVKIPIVGHAMPVIRMPKKNKRGEWINWSNTALPWMSIGYETLIPPIYTLTFYNAIANNGRMMQPRFVKSAIKDGDTIATFPPQVVSGKEHIASDRTLRIMQDLLHRVVLNGTGKKAFSPNYWVCGKTGTAMIASNGNYRGTAHSLLSFAGWFGQKDRPYYSCIVCIQKYGLPAYGWMSSEVFKDIADGIMARYVRYNVSDARDADSRMIPDVKAGNILSADFVLSSLGISTFSNYPFKVNETQPVWGVAERRRGSVKLIEEKASRTNVMPDVRGMGARDAVFLAESSGVKCTIKGRGKVSEQSIEPGKKVRRGQKCVLTLQ